ncbi:MAG: hypothetical protein ABSB79_08160 [Syntrophales bacterium]
MDLCRRPRQTDQKEEERPVEIGKDACGQNIIFERDSIRVNKFKSVIISQLPFFVISFIIFITAATFGWERLHYGFNFIDEGYHMTEAWRLTVGDLLFQDKIRGAIDLSPFINSLFFRIWPDVTLLGFRELQYILTICALALFSLSLYKIHGQYWYLPLVFSIFAFTGSDPVFMISNLNYYSYQNLFITPHLSFLLLGLNQTFIIPRRALFIIAGFFLWLISFNLLHLSVVLFSPIILFYFLRKWKIDSIYYNFKDLCYTLAPGIICWMVFIVIFNISYIQNVISSINLISATSYHSREALVRINWAPIERICILIIYLIASLYCLLRLRMRYFIIIFTVLSAVIYFIIDTSLFGLISYPEGFVFFSRPMWFSSLLISFFIILICYIFFKMKVYSKFKRTDVIGIVLVIPCIIIAASSSVFSSFGLLTVMHSSIPVIGSMAILTLSHKKISVKSYPLRFLILLIFFAPFYYSTAWSDWRFTYFDVVPEQATVEIDKGFGKGIKTNLVYKALYNWIDNIAHRYTGEGDFIISYIKSPMIHMIARRRPALDSSFIDVECPFSYYQAAINRMKNDRREPKVAFVFERYPQLYPLSVDKDAHYTLFPRIFTFPSADPISQYIVQNMTFLDQFQITEDFIVRCFIKKR